MQLLLVCVKASSPRLLIDRWTARKKDAVKVYYLSILCISTRWVVEILVARNLNFGDFRLVEVVEEFVHMEPNKSTNREVVNWCCWGSTSKKKLDTWNCQMAIRKSNGLLSWFSRCDVANRKVMDIHGWMDVLCTNFLFPRWGCVIYERPGSHKEHGSHPQRVAIQRGSQCVPRKRKQSRRHIRGWAERLLGMGHISCGW